MKYRAVCPCCGHRLPRNGYFHPNHECPSCGAAIRPEPKWNQVGNVIGGTILFFAMMVGALYVAAFGMLGAVVGVGLFVGVLALGWLSYPYCTPYEAVRPTGPAAPAPVPAGPADPMVVTRVANRVYEIPPVPRYGRMTAVGLILCFVAVAMWAASFTCRSTCRGYESLPATATPTQEPAADLVRPETAPSSEPDFLR